MSKKRARSAVTIVPLGISKLVVLIIHDLGDSNPSRVSPGLGFHNQHYPLWEFHAVPNG